MEIPTGARPPTADASGADIRGLSIFDYDFSKIRPNERWFYTTGLQGALLRKGRNLAEFVATLGSSPGARAPHPRIRAAQIFWICQ